MKRMQAWLLYKNALNFVVAGTARRAPAPKFHTSIEQISMPLCILLVLVFLCNTVSVAFASSGFEITNEGMRYVVRDAGGAIVQQTKPIFDAPTGAYVVKDNANKIIARQELLPEADMSQIKIVAPLQGDSHSVTAKDFLGKDVPVLRELPSTDTRYQQLKGYIDADSGLRNVLAMQLEARNMKVERLQQEIGASGHDAQLTTWLTNDLKKPIYLEVGDSGPIYHDARGFVLAEQASNGHVDYRDNACANRLVIPPNSEVFQGGMKDSAAASVIAHEAGHMIMDQVYETPNYPKTNYAGPHSKDSVTDEGFAISEGWAEALETISNKDRLNNASSWRVQSQKNIADNKYIFKNQGVLDGVQDGILKNGSQQLSTEGVNATLFYNMLKDSSVQAPYEKVLHVFEQTKPQTYRDFLKNYMDQYPEDRSNVIRQFLETTKYTTVDSGAIAKYKSLFDAEQAFKTASPDQPELYARLQGEYQAKLNDYNQYKEQLYKQAVVDGNIDKAIGGGSGGEAAVATRYSDETNSRFRQVKLSETILKGQKALAVGGQRAIDSIKQSFSVKNVAITAGTSIAMNLASQLMSGQKVSLKEAGKAVASLAFVGNVVGSTMGAAMGHAIAPLIQTFVPIPIVGTIAGALLPTLASIAGGQFGSNIGARMSFKDALKNLDPVAIAGQTVGSTIGMMLGAMIPIPVLGPMLGGMIGGILGEKVFKGIAKLFNFSGKNAKEMPVASPVIPKGDMTSQCVQTSPSLKVSGQVHGSDPLTQRIDPSIDRIPYGEMNPNLRSVKDEYEKAYLAYVNAIGDGNSGGAQSKLNEFISIRERYRRALGAYIK
ncbi:MAG: hypothetical protein HQM09_01505 [Candidatus Riflebacteria bacterium]|nr:hypothetical protein [Candidatus Riflebacteria bacterium]